jgi:hypothetical protein
MRNPPFLKGESKGDLKVGVAPMRPVGSLIKNTTTLMVIQIGDMLVENSIGVSRFSGTTLTKTIEL